MVIGLERQINADMDTVKPQQKVQTAVCSDSDVPKITVFKSPPWQKPAITIPTPKLTDVYEEFPVKSRLNGRRLSLSMSLECIPENTILQDIHKHTSTLNHRDNNRLSPHQILPPIGRHDDDLPEMRQRAYSDPHKYTSYIKRRAEERRESPLASKQSAGPLSPLKDTNNHMILTPDGKTNKRANQKDSANKQQKSPTTALPSSKTSGTASPESTKKSRNSENCNRSTQSPSKDSKPPHPTTSRRKVISPIKPATPNTPDNRVSKNKKLIERNMNGEACPPHPTIAALKESESRVRTNSLPGSLDIKRRSGLGSPIPRQTHAGVKKSMAYALVGSPGRNRWPSPDRNTSNFISTPSTPSISDEAEPTDSSIESSTENLQTTGTSPSSKPLAPINASAEFKSIYKDLQTGRTK